MSLLAEQLVEEWMNRQGFFTVRGLRDGVGEMDLLGVRNDGRTIEGLHIEAQVSFRPVSYVAPLTEKLRIRLGTKAKTSAKKRTDAEVEECVMAWVERKFTSKEKRKIRDLLWPGLDWEFRLVHGVIKNDAELAAFKRHPEIKLVPFRQVLADLCQEKRSGYSGAVGGDIAEITRYYAEDARQLLTPPS